MPRFVLLRHECPADYRDGPHWDLMLERGGTAASHRLATWSLLSLPSAWSAALAVVDDDGGDEVEAVALPDHRAEYLDYEGPVSGDRGFVTRIAGGGMEWLEEPSPRVTARLIEGPLACRLTLEAIGGDRWRLRID